MTDDHAVRATYLDRKHDDADTMWMWATVFLFAMLAVPIYLGYRLGLWLFGNDLRDSAVEQPRPNPVHYKNPIHSQKEHMLQELPR